MEDLQSRGPLSADTEPGPPPTVTEPGSAPNDTEPDGQDPPRRALPFELEAEDEEVASLLGRMAPARVAPAVGDTPETDGHEAAKFRGAPHAPPRPHQTPTPQAPVIVDVTTPDPVDLSRNGQRPAATLDTTVVPAERRARLRWWMLLPAISTGAIVAATAVAVVARSADAPTSPVTSAPPALLTTSPVERAQSSSAAASSIEPAAPSRQPSHPKPRAMPSGRTTAAPKPPISSARPASSTSPSALPPDIKWRID